MNRTHNNGELRIEHVNQTVELKGWVAKQRNLGGLIFIDLRDRFGITQIVVEPTNANYEIAETARNEYVVYVEGQVVERQSKNKNIPTGEIEVVASKFEILNTAQTTPLIISDDTDALEDTRLKYRYLDLRRPVMQNFLIKRHQITQAIRESLLNNDFLELETPILAKSTPEGARDYLVPSRLYPGEFYALPQSPQIFKQLFMVSGLERYFQVARCFRDEDLRADRQPEFTQIDIEASFITEEEIQTLTENTFKHLFKKVLNLDIPTPFARMAYTDAMNNYGSDKPDTRFEMLLTDLTEVAKSIDFKVFSDALENNGAIKAIVVKNHADQYSRKNIDALTDFVKKYKAKGLAWVKFDQNDFNGSIAKFLNDENKQALVETLKLENNDLVLIVADSLDVCNQSLGALRLEVGKQLNLIDPNKFNFLWVVDWPLFEYDEELGRYFAAHHPFTAPKDEHKEMLLSNPGECVAKAYDVVLNGYEVGGGSLRIFNQKMQSEMFSVLGFSEEEAKERFGFFIDALKYGTPPHGGIALGLDRIVMIMTQTDNIKDVVAFPKTQSARCPMMDGPGEVADAQLDELHIKTITE